MAIRGDAAGQALALPADGGEMGLTMGGAASRQDPARARQRRLPEPPPRPRHWPARVIAMCNQ